MINNRQQPGRRRGRGGGNPGGNPGGQRQGNPGRPDNGNRIDSRARGNASQLYEKYKNMASDAQRQGDRVNTEYYLQFADHYFRVLSEQRGRNEEQQPRRARDDFDFDGNGEFGGEEFGDEGEPARANDGGDGAMAPQRFDREDRQNEARQQRDDRARNDNRDDRPRAEGRDDRPRNEARNDRPRAEARDDRPRGDSRDGAQRDGNGDARPRGEWQERPPRRERRPDQPRTEQQRTEQPRTEQARGEQAEQATDPLPEQRLDLAPQQPLVEVAGQRRADPMTPGETLEGRAEEVLEADRPLDAPPARRRGRPRRDAEPVMAEANDMTEANGFEADRLPPALTPTLTADDDEAPAKPRRRRARPAEGAPDAAE